MAPLLSRYNLIIYSSERSPPPPKKKKQKSATGRICVRVGDFILLLIKFYYGKHREHFYLGDSLLKWHLRTLKYLNQNYPMVYSRLTLKYELSDSGAQTRAINANYSRWFMA